MISVLSRGSLSPLLQLSLQFRLSHHASEGVPGTRVGFIAVLAVCR